MDNNGFANKNDGNNYGNGSGYTGSYGNGSNNGYNNGYNTTDSTYVGKFGYRGNKQFAPLSAWGYFGYSLLFGIPLVGLICAIVFAFSDENINRRSYARASLLVYVIAIVIVVLFFLVGLIGAAAHS